MKTKKLFTMGAIIFAFLISPILQAQDEAEAERPGIMVVTTIHWNPDKTDGSNEAWLAIEKEYHEKVTMKNDHIMGANFAVHYFTADNSEAKAVMLYKDLAAIDQANARTNELIEEGWPDEEARKAFFKERNSYYSTKHSDEIYSVLDGAKQFTAKPEDGILYYVRTSHMAFPADAPAGEMKELHSSFNENVTFKNEYVQAYWPYRHFWGGDSREFLEVYAVKSLADLEAMLKKINELVDDAWTEDEQKEFGDKYGKYWTGFHADYIYSGVVDLMK